MMAMREVLCAHCMVPVSHTHKDDCPYLAGIRASGIEEPRWPWLPPEPENKNRHTAHISEMEAAIAQDHLRAAIKALHTPGPVHALVAIRAAMDVLGMKEQHQ